MNKQRLIRLAAAAAAVLCLASCGKVDQEEPKEGSVTLATLKTTTTIDAVSVTKGPELTMSGETEPSETTTKKKKDENAETTKKSTLKKVETTTTTSATTTKAPETIIVEVPVETEPPQEDPQPEEPQPEEPQQSFADKLKISYNGQEFAVGDQFSDVEGRLGAQTSPSEEVPSCINGHSATAYHFDGMDITVHEGVIYQVTIDDMTHVSSDVKLVSGVGLGANADDVVNALGGDGLERGDDLVKYNHDGFEVQVTFSNGGAIFYMIQRPELG